MTLGRYVESIGLGGIVLVSLGIAAVSLRRKSLPTWSGAPARLVELIIAISLVVVVSQALGSVGLFRVGPLVIALVLVASLTFWVGRTGAGDPESATAVASPPVAPHSRQEAWWEPVAAILAVSLVAAEWSAGTIHALQDGISGIDSLWYHMPISAEFAQSGSVATLHNINNDNVIEFYPATSELLHAVGILLLGGDFLSPLINAIWLGFALFAAWCLGRRYGVGSLTTMATALVLGTTEVIADEPGTAYNDLVGAALILAALALLAYVDVPWGRRGHVQGLWTAALAAGLAVGVKDTFVLPVAALTVGVIALLPRGQRIRQGLVWCLFVVVTGGFWYGRNLIYAAQPGPKHPPRTGIPSAAEFARHPWNDDCALAFQRSSMEIVFSPWVATGFRPGLVGAGGHCRSGAHRWNRRGRAMDAPNAKRIPTRRRTSHTAHTRSW